MGCKSSSSGIYFAGESSDAVAGSILGFTPGGPANNFSLATNAIPARGVALGPAAPGGAVTVMTLGQSLVALDGNDVGTPAIGSPIWVSTTDPGFGTCTAPSRPMTLVGFVTDNADYDAVTNPFVTGFIFCENVLNRLLARIALGDAQVTGAGGIAIGEAALCAHNDSIAIGQGATTTAIQQVIIGSTVAPINDAQVLGTGGGITFRARATGVPTDSTGLSCAVDRASVVTFGNVISLGAADSGGSGFKLLRVAN